LDAVYKVLALFFLASCASCRDVSRVINLCLIETKTAYCTVDGKNYALVYPDALKNWVAFDEVGLNHIASRKEECRTIGKLPASGDTLFEANPCSIGGSCGDKNLEGYWAVDRVSWGKLRDFFGRCGEHPVMVYGVDATIDPAGRSVQFPPVTPF
jgi:hypothetical protein